jgi:hypothetical protein
MSFSIRFAMLSSPDSQVDARFFAVYPIVEVFAQLSSFSFGDKNDIKKSVIDISPWHKVEIRPNIADVQCLEQDVISGQLLPSSWTTIGAAE